MRDTGRSVTFALHVQQLLPALYDNCFPHFLSPAAYLELLRVLNLASRILSASDPAFQAERSRSGPSLFAVITEIQLQPALFQGVFARHAADVNRVLSRKARGTEILRILER